MNTNNQLYTAWSTILTFYIYVMIKKLMLVETAVIIRDKKHINLNKPHTSIADTLYDNNTTASYYTYTTNRRLIGIFINISWNRKMLGIRPKRHLGCFQEKINRDSSLKKINQREGHFYQHLEIENQSVGALTTSSVGLHRSSTTTA